MANPDQADVALVGAVLDEAYCLTRLISRGGMGTVYEALQLRLNKRVAIKVMAEELAAEPEALARFHREVQVTSGLAHPHVVQLLDFGKTSAGQPYLVMEYLEGEDLEQRLARVGALAVAPALDILRQAAAALSAIHAKGVVHRDLKPANIFLLPLDGTADFVKLVDFGISKVRTARTKLTQAFTMIGTPEYMSPEQATGQVDAIDHRSDQWALGCIAFHMLTGKLPFPGTHLNELLHKVVNDPPPSLSQVAPHVPPALDDVLRKALAKRQADRFPTVMAFARALEAAAAPPPPRAAPVRVVERPRGGSGKWLLAFMTSAALGVGAWYAHRTVDRWRTPCEELAPPPEPERPASPKPTRRARPAGAATNR